MMVARLVCTEFSTFWLHIKISPFFWHRKDILCLKDAGFFAKGKQEAASTFLYLLVFKDLYLKIIHISM